MNEKEKIVIKQIQRLEKRRDKLNDEISHQKELLKLICTHSETYEEDEYYEGSYYNKSEYIKVNICRICGRKVNLKQTLGSHV